jgi:tRNA nucleotidyltransferase (CCA-adding enzyme)
MNETESGSASIPAEHRIAAHLASMEREESGGHAESYRRALGFAEQVRDEGGQALLVGGCVRDMLLGIVPKDYDMEVRGLPPAKVLELAERIGHVDEMGKAYGILKLQRDGVDLDISLPRRDSKVAEGHTGFDVNTDPHLSVEEAARRRDFTINAIGVDPLSGEVHDPFDGVTDLEARCLRVVDPETFVDDPLRALRAIQFVGRFELELDPETAEIVRAMAPFLPELSGERFKDEWDKLLLQSERPSLGLRIGQELGVYEHMYPQFTPLSETPQHLQWHPEGDVWIHTCMVVDRAAELVRTHELPEEEARVIMLAALCHDLGKPKTTKLKDGRYVAPGHEAAGLEPAKRFLDTLTSLDNASKAKVLRLVEWHTVPRQLHRLREAHGHEVKDGPFRRLAVKVHPATMEDLALVFEADMLGRGPFPEPAEGEPSYQEYVRGGAEWFRKRVQALGIQRKRPSHIVTGKDLLELGFKSDPAFGEIIRAANDLRDDLDMDREQIMELLRGHDTLESARAAVAAPLAAAAEAS